VLRKPTVTVSSTVAPIPDAMTAGWKFQGRSNTVASTAQESALANPPPRTPPTAPSSAYSTANDRAMNPRVAP